MLFYVNHGPQGRTEATCIKFLSIIRHILTFSKNNHSFLHEICTVWSVNALVHSINISSQGAAGVCVCGGGGVGVCVWVWVCVGGWGGGVFGCVGVCGCVCSIQQCFKNVWVTCYQDWVAGPIRGQLSTWKWKYCAVSVKSVRFGRECKQSVSNIFLICHILWHFQDGCHWPWEFNMGQKLNHAPISLKIVSNCLSCDKNSKNVQFIYISDA